MLSNTTHPPLVEPDMKISLIRLSQRHSCQAMGGPHTVLALQVHQTHAADVLVVAYSLGWPTGPLASASDMLRQTLSYIGIDLSKPLARITIAKVVRPTVKMPIKLFNKFRQRYEAALFAGHLTQHLPLFSQSLLRYAHIEIAMAPASQIALITK